MLPLVWKDATFDIAPPGSYLYYLLAPGLVPDDDGTIEEPATPPPGRADFPAILDDQIQDLSDDLPPPN